MKGTARMKVKFSLLGQVEGNEAHILGDMELSVPFEMGGTDKNPQLIPDSKGLRAEIVAGLRATADELEAAL